MSDHIPFEVQEEIIKRLPVKSLIQFRSVSKAWKSLIDSSEFIASHSTHHAHSHRLLVRYGKYPERHRYYVSFADDENLPQEKFEPTVPLSIVLLIPATTRMIASSHGLFCLYGSHTKIGDLHRPIESYIAVIWNPSIRKSVTVAVPSVLCGLYKTVLGFGVCPGTSDVKLVRITCSSCYVPKESFTCIPWQVEIYTLSSGSWRSLCGNIPCDTIAVMWSHVVIDGFIYWFAVKWIAKDDVFWACNLIMSFDLTTDEFREVSLPDSLAHQQPFTNSFISKLRESLAVLECSTTALKQVCSVWEMKHGVSKSFTKLFTIEVPVASINKVLGFTKSGKPLIVMEDDITESYCTPAPLVVYEPSSGSINDLGINGYKHSFFAKSYMETLLLLNVPEV